MKTYYLTFTLSALVFFSGGCGPSEPASIESIDPGWSISGPELIFVKDGQINLFDPGSAEVRVLTSGEEKKYAPAWLPTGQEIIYLSLGAEYAQFIKLNLTNLESTFLAATKGQPSYFSISPLGDQLFYLEDQALFLLDLLSGTTKKIAEQASYPVWSPYGENIAFVSLAESLKIYSLQDESLTEVYQGAIFSPQFYQNQSLIFAQKQEGGYNLIKLNLNNPGSPEIFISLGWPELDQGQLSFSPDKKYLLLSSAQANYLIDLKDKSLAPLPANGFDWLWAKDEAKLYYHLIKADGDDLVYYLYQADYQGKQKKLILANAASTVSSVQFKTQTLNY